jgi:hypothetical protein
MPHTIAIMMMMTRKARRTRSKRKRRRARRPSRRRRVVHMWSLGIVILPQVMMTRPPRRRVMQALPYKRSLLSSTLIMLYG